jgi:hypothetical protein
MTVSLIWVVQSPLQKYFASRLTQITGLSRASHPLGGALAIVTDVGMGCGGRGSVVAQGDCRAGVRLNEGL